MKRSNHTVPHCHYLHTIEQLCTNSLHRSPDIGPGEVEADISPLHLGQKSNRNQRHGAACGEAP